MKKVKSVEVKIKVIDANDKIYEGTFENMADAGKFMEDMIKEIYEI